MQEALLYKKLKNKMVQCRNCAHYCVISSEARNKVLAEGEVLISSEARNKVLAEGKVLRIRRSLSKFLFPREKE